MQEGHDKYGRFILHMNRKHIELNEVFDINGDIIDTSVPINVGTIENVSNTHIDNSLNDEQSKRYLLCKRVKGKGKKFYNSLYASDESGKNL